VPIRAISLGLIFFLAGAAQGAKPTLDEARELHQRGALREAQQAYESLLPELRSEPAGLGAALKALTRIAYAQGQYESGAARAREAIEVYRASGDKGGEAHAIHLLAVAELYQGKYPSALSLLEKALALGRSIGDREREIEELNNIGTVHFHQARYLEALRAYRQALDSVRQAEDTPPWLPRLRRITITNLAALFQQVGHEDQAIELYGELRNSPEVLNPIEQARLRSNLGDLYRRLGDPAKALETYRVAQKLLAGNEHKQLRSAVLTNIGIVQALDLGDLPVALATFTEAVSLAEQIEDRRQAAFRVGQRQPSGTPLLAKIYFGKHRFPAWVTPAQSFGATKSTSPQPYGPARRRN